MTVEILSRRLRHSRTPRSGPTADDDFVASLTAESRDRAQGCVVDQKVDLVDLDASRGSRTHLAREVWSYVFPSKTDEPPSDAPPREAAADVQRQGAASPPDAPPSGSATAPAGPDVFLKEDRRKPPAQAAAPSRESVDFGRRAENSPSGPLSNGRGRPRGGPW